MSDNNSHKIDFEVISKLLADLKTPLEKYKQKDFNIFIAFSDTYYKENLHSAILAYILDPSTPRIGNIAYLKTFLKETDKDLINYSQDGNSVKILREKGRIDILISNGSQCIIIENKINDAEDQPNQLCRYYNYARQKGLEVLKIFYIPLDISKNPDVENYNCANSNDYEFCKSCKHQSEIKQTKKEIKKLIQTVTVENLIEILQKCSAKADTLEYKAQDYITAKVFMEHYVKLLCKLGDNMSDTNKEILEGIFEYINKGKISSGGFSAAASVWSKREEIINNILKEYLLNKDYNNFNYIAPKKSVLKKQVTENKAIIFYPEWGTFALEVKTNNWDTEKGLAKEQLYKAARLRSSYFIQLKDNNSVNGVKDDYLAECKNLKDIYWVYLNFGFSNENITDNFDDIIKNALNCFDDLENELLEEEKIKQSNNGKVI